MRAFWETDGTLFAKGDPSEPFQLANKREVRPFAKDVLELLSSMGVENFLWSRAGRENACAAAKALGVSEDRCIEKPEFQEPQEMRVLKQTPDVVIDDDPDETVLMFPHVVIKTYTGGVEDDELLKILSQLRQHFDDLVKEPEETLTEFRMRFRRKKRASTAVKMARRKYYRAHRGYYRRYKRRWKRKPRAKRLAKLHKRLASRFHSKLRKFRLRVAI